MSISVDTPMLLLIISFIAGLLCGVAMTAISVMAAFGTAIEDFIKRYDAMKPPP